MQQDGPLRVEDSDVEVGDTHEDSLVLVRSSDPDVMQLGSVAQGQAQRDSIRSSRRMKASGAPAGPPTAWTLVTRKVASVWTVVRPIRPIVDINPTLHSCPSSLPGRWGSSALHGTVSKVIRAQSLTALPMSSNDSSPVL